MSEKTVVEYVLAAPWLVPIRPHGVLEQHGLAIGQGRICDLGPQVELRARYPSARWIDLPHHVLLPGLVNSHTHAAMSLLRGLADDLPLMTWLEQHIWPAEGRFVGPEFVATGTRLAIAEMLRGGTTCFNDMYFYPEAAAQAVVESGIRASLGQVVIDFPTAQSRDAGDALRRAEMQILQLRDLPRIRQSIAPHAPYTVPDHALREAKALARSHGLFLHMHVHETAQEVENARTQDGRRPLQRLDELGILDEHFLAVHMTQLTTEDLDLVAQRGLRLAHCPESNLKLGSGIADVAQWQARGIPFGIGTDGAASNNDLDLFGELRTAALLAKGRDGDTTALAAAVALEAATLGGAMACGWGDSIGSLEIGKLADCIAVDLDHPATQPLYDPISQLVYCAGRDQVSHVWVNGELLVNEGRWTRLDWPGLRAQAQTWARRIAAKDRQA